MANRSKGKEFLESILGKVQEFDQGYSDKIAAMYQDKGPVGQVAGYFLGGHPSFKKPEDVSRKTELDRALAPLIEYGVPAVNAVPKYVLPTTGVTLAGKALYDLIQLLGDGQTDSELRM